MIGGEVAAEKQVRFRVGNGDCLSLVTYLHKLPLSSY